jgi:hypothetical protein
MQEWKGEAIFFLFLIHSFQSFDFSARLEPKAFDTEGYLLTPGPPGSLFFVKTSSRLFIGKAEYNMKVYEITEVVELNHLPRFWGL